MDQNRIRNFSIVAHIDHGKSTLADRLLETTGTVSKREMREQLLDTMDLERERGITIKAQTARLLYKARDGHEYYLNLIDTPGHVDFSYEVSRSLAACEGALLVVDASQGIEAQTVANFYKALEQNLDIIPVINKIDLPAADPAGVMTQLHDLMGTEEKEVIYTSAKDGRGVEDMLEAIVKRIPPPQGDPSAPPRALVIDSIFNQFRGVIAYVRIVDGSFQKDDVIQFMGSGKVFEIEEVGIFLPKAVPAKELPAGSVGYIVANIREVTDVQVGDTITLKKNPAAKPLPGYQPAKSMVFCGMYPTNTADFELLRAALEKLQLNDAGFHFEPETSAALGFGFRCGFLGLLHMDVVQERLEREFDLDLVITAPNVEYVVHKENGEELIIDNPSQLPEPHEIKTLLEPFIEATIITKPDTIGSIMKLAMDRRGMDKGLEYIGPDRVIMRYEFPLAEIVSDFYDRLKSVSRGYASFDYEFIDDRPGHLTKLDILVNGEPVDALSVIVHHDTAYEKGKALVQKLRKVVPRQQYDVAIQAAAGSRIIARETVKALRKNVTAKCYGGDITRKRKLLERQKEGKRRMKNVGNVEIPQEAFMAVLNLD